MTTTPSTSPAPHAPGLDRAIAARFNRLAGGYWRGSTARQAWWWTLGLAFCLVLKLGVDVTVNHWNRWFFDALERRDAADAADAVLTFGLIALCVAAVGAGIVLTRETLQVRWRQWVTAQLLDRWMSGQRFFHLTRSTRGLANPEYRISDDVRLATEPLVDFAIGLFTALLSASTFVGILWSVGGSLNVRLAGGHFEIPAFMVIGAIIYGVTMSTLVPLAGRRLPQATAARNESEALFRAETIHLRENAESIALTRAEGSALERLDAIYAILARNWMAMVRQHVNVTWVMNASSALIPVVPLVLALPKYLAGELSLGQVIQLASAFAQVQIAIGWLADNYRNVAEWFASARRVVELVDAFDAVDTGADGMLAPRVETRTTDAGSVEIRDLRLSDRDGKVVTDAGTSRFDPGDRVLIGGEAVAGKLELARALSGLWPWGSGEIGFPSTEPPTFLGATPFLPEGRLADAILCPAEPDSITDRLICVALDAVELSHLAPRLGEKGRWMQALSLAERQRCAIARAILRKPPLIIVEDALSACDANAQARATEALFSLGRASIIVDFSNRPAPDDLYNRRLMLVPADGTPTRLVEGATAWSDAVETAAI